MTRIPVMTLRDVVLFPQAMIPLHIFEPRYRAMLRDILREDRTMAIGTIDPEAEDAGEFEAIHDVATLGIVRACQEKEDGTSDLVLQGLQRVRVMKILQEEPYRIIEAAPIKDETAEIEDLDSKRDELFNLIRTLRDDDFRLSGDVLDLLRNLEGARAFIDVTAYTLCSDTDTKLNLLRSARVEDRYFILRRYFHQLAGELKLNRHFQRNFPDSDVTLN